MVRSVRSHTHEYVMAKRHETDFLRLVRPPTTSPCHDVLLPLQRRPHLDHLRVRRLLTDHSTAPRGLRQGRERGAFTVHSQCPQQHHACARPGGGCIGCPAPRGHGPRGFHLNGHGCGRCVPAQQRSGRSPRGGALPEGRLLRCRAWSGSPAERHHDRARGHAVQRARLHRPIIRLAAGPPIAGWLPPATAGQRACHPIRNALFGNLCGGGGALRHGCTGLQRGHAGR